MHQVLSKQGHLALLQTRASPFTLSQSEETPSGNSSVQQISSCADRVRVKLSGEHTVSYINCDTS